MAEARITKRLVDGLQATGSDYYVFDTDLTGFGIRVRATGGMSYIVQYKGGSGRGAPTRRVTMGAIGKMAPEQARKAAERVLGSVAHGHDPASEKRRSREAMTVADLCEAFMAKHVRAKRKDNTSALYGHIVASTIVPTLGAKKAEALSKGDVAKLHLDLRDRPYLANRTLAVIGSMYTWAGKHGLVDDNVNPAARIEKFAEKPRERFLTTAELERLGAAIREGETSGIPWEPDPAKKVKHSPRAESRRVAFGPHAAAAMRLLLFTGARLREILHLRWEHVDIERGLLLLPDSKTGKKTIVLNAPAMMVLAELPRVGAYVIAGENPEKPRADLKRPWTAVSKRAGLDGVRLHDLRHTHASFGVGASFGLPILGKLLGHTQLRTTERYAHLETDPLRRASNAIGEALSVAMGDKMAGNTLVKLSG